MALETAVSLSILSAQALTTAWFIRFLVNWYQLLMSRTEKYENDTDKNIFKKPAKNKRTEEEKIKRLAESGLRVRSSSFFECLVLSDEVCSQMEKIARKDIDYIRNVLNTHTETTTQQKN